MKAATLALCNIGCGQKISIHAAREGGDAITDDVLPKGSISIHAAREGGDPLRFPLLGSSAISIHAAREGGDARAVRACFFVRNFNPRRP